MDGLQRQIFDLNHKVDQLHEIVEVIGHQITAITSEKQQCLESTPEPLATLTQIRKASAAGNGRMYSVMEHKDILVEGNGGQNNHYSNNEQELSSDIQIRRLTAQLTAAYNRIAVLEEQLLACRINS